MEYDETESRPPPRWVGVARWVLVAVAVAAMTTAFLLAALA